MKKEYLLLLIISLISLFLPKVANAQDYTLRYLPGEYKSINELPANMFSEGLTIINQNGKYFYKDKNGEQKIKQYFGYSKLFSEGFAAVSNKGKWGFIDKAGHQIIPFIYEDAGNFNEGLAPVKRNSYYGYINKKGEMIITPQFNFGGIFSEGLASVKKGNLYGYINQEGDYVIKPQFDEAGSFHNGLALINTNNKYGYINKKGSIVVKPQYEWAGEFNDGLAPVKKDNKYGYINVKGNWIIKPQFEKAYRFNDGFAIIKKGDKYGIISLTGDIVLESEFDYAVGLNEGIALIQSNNRWKFAELIPLNLPPLKEYIQNNLETPVSFVDYIKPKIVKDINEWQKKGEFESTNVWITRVNDETRKEKIKDLTENYKQEYKKILEVYQINYNKLCEEYYHLKSLTKKQSINLDKLILSQYDADNESFMISSDDHSFDILLKVPIEEAPLFKNNWSLIRKTADLNYVPNGDDVVLASISFTNGNNQYKYDGNQNIKYALTEIDYNFNPIEINSLGDYQIQYNFDPTNYPQYNTIGIEGNKVKVDNNTISIGNLSEVDREIPQNYFDNGKTFAVIIGNEIYQDVANVPFAENDARIIATYFEKTLGIPSKNIRFYNNATFAQILSAIKDIQDISNAYHGDIDVIFYYAGHGIPNESNGESFILPVDADGRQIEVCYPMSKLYSELGNMGTNSVTIFLDACFSGSVRGNEMLAGARGIKIKSKPSDPIGNMIILSAASGDETAYPFKEKGHGLFTYFLLKKLQESKGDVTIGELSEYIIDSVSKESIVSNGKPQTPTVQVSPSLTSSWKQMKLKN